MKSFLTVKEFSRYTNINEQTLRYWDKIKLFSPTERNKNNNYRLYSIKQTINVHFISLLSKLDIPFKTISTLINNKETKEIVDLLKQQQYVINMKLQKLHDMSAVINARIYLIERGLTVNSKEIGIVDMPEIPIIMGKDIIVNEDQSFYDIFFDFCRQTEENNVDLSFPVGAYYKDAETFFNNPCKPNNLFSIVSDRKTKLKSGKYLTGYAHGYYGEIIELVEKLKAYSKQNSISLSEPVYIIYLHDDICVQNPNDYLVQICIGIKK